MNLSDTEPDPGLPETEGEPEEPISPEVGNPPTDPPPDEVAEEPWPADAPEGEDEV